MKNDYFVCGDVTVILCRHRDRDPSYVLIDTSDLELVASIPGRWSVSKTGPTPRSPYYCHYHERATAGYKNVYLHRFLTNAPADSDVDHVSRDGLDNRRSNLRVGTTKDNLRRRILFDDTNENNTVTGVRNVVLNPWGSYQVSVCGQYYGSYSTIEEADAVAKQVRAQINKIKAA